MIYKQARIIFFCDVVQQKFYLIDTTKLNKILSLKYTRVCPRHPKLGDLGNPAQKDGGSGCLIRSPKFQIGFNNIKA